MLKPAHKEQPKMTDGHDHSNVSQLFPVSRKGMALKARSEVQAEAAFEACLDEQRWRDLMLSKINPSASRVWWQVGRRPTRVACSVTVPGQRFWIWVNTSYDYDSDENDFGCGVGVEIISEELNVSRRAQSRYVERAERSLAHAIKNARSMVECGF
jgi:hypothetical protein